jgi:hypothetical protein
MYLSQVNVVDLYKKEVSGLLAWLHESLKMTCQVRRDSMRPVYKSCCAPFVKRLKLESFIVATAKTARSQTQTLAA